MLKLLSDFPFYFLQGLIGKDQFINNFFSQYVEILIFKILGPWSQIKKVPNLFDFFSGFKTGPEYGLSIVIRIVFMLIIDRVFDEIHLYIVQLLDRVVR